MKDVITQRYTSSTCTLEVVGQRSALSRWTTMPVLKQLRFRLHLSNSDASGKEQVLIQGDRNQLAGLIEAVHTYIQSRLTPIAAAPGLETLENLTPSPRTRLAEHVQREAESTVATSLGIFIQSQGLTRHILCLGVLATDSIGPEMQLSTLQLFDLTHVLDEYEAAAIALPPLKQPVSRRSRLTARIGWTGAAAATVLATVGLATTLPRVLNHSQLASNPAASTHQAAMDDSEEHSIASHTFGDVQTESAASLNPVESREEISSQLEESSQLADNSNQSDPKPSEQSSQKSAPLLSSHQLQNQPAALYPAPTSPVPPAALSPAPPAPLASSPASTSATSPPPPAPSAASTQPYPPNPASPLPTARRPEAEWGEESSNSAASSADAQMAPPLASISSTRADLPGRTTASGPLTTRPLTTEDSTIGMEPEPIPQLEEIRVYFQLRWRPPENLNQVLAYHLVISPEGTIEEIMPIGPVAETYRDRIDFPSSDEPIFSPVQPGEVLKIRLVFSLNGTVVVFQE